MIHLESLSFCDSKATLSATFPMGEVVPLWQKLPYVFQPAVQRMSHSLESISDRATSPFCDPMSLIKFVPNRFVCLQVASTAIQIGQELVGTFGGWSGRQASRNYRVVQNSSPLPCPACDWLSTSDSAEQAEQDYQRCCTHLKNFWCQARESPASQRRYKPGGRYRSPYL
jgi:hypothetical protein